MNSGGLNPEINMLYEEGEACFLAGNIAGSVEKFLKIVVLDPYHSPSWNNLGVAAYKQNRMGDAEQYFQKACETDPENLDALTNLADYF